MIKSVDSPHHSEYSDASHRSPFRAPHLSVAQDLHTPVRTADIENSRAAYQQNTLGYFHCDITGIDAC
ncbi:Uncharacterised protein [Vibrio cholerae]|uniref:Uncharacterized protein n=1 Tax=Vibrio cholerae TaxID=666 RepID=A0A655SGX9_VIBCL|nr:Uncharacterised protein [Vibrio cholerae]CSC52834.1 Uncharacterised protein [Vibrio cholerae]CSI21648.1 Uncharacterised protein [Vibrio cholerae]